MTCSFFCDVIFNSPKPESSSWFKDYGSLIGNAVTIFLFIIAYFINDYRENKRKKKLFEEKLRYLTSLIVSSKKIAENQKSKIEASLKKFKEENQFEFYLVQVISFLDIKRISEKLNLEDYFLAYLSRYGNNTESVNQFRSIIQGFDFLNEFNTDLYNFLERSSNNHDNRLFKFNAISEKIDSLMYEVEKWIRQGSPEKLDEYFTIVNQYYSATKHNTNGEELLKFKNAFSSPMLKFIGKHYSNYNTTIIFHLRQLLDTAEGELRIVRSGIEKFSKELEERIEPLKSAIEKIEKGSEKLVVDFAP